MADHSRKRKTPVKWTSQSKALGYRIKNEPPRERKPREGIHWDPEGTTQACLPLNQLRYLPLPDQPTAQGLISHHLAGSEGQLVDQAARGQGVSGDGSHPGVQVIPCSPLPGALPTHLWLPMILGSRCSVPTSAAKPMSTSWGSNHVSA